MVVPITITPDRAEFERYLEDPVISNYLIIMNGSTLITNIQSTGLKEKIEDIIKKASIAIQRHKVSKWVDDSYILVGIARMLSREYEESIETFKYVNVTSDDEPTQHEALIHLIRTFTEYGELNNALAVIDYLNRQKLSKTNKKNFYLQAAYYSQITNNPNNLIKYLSKQSRRLDFRRDPVFKCQIVFLDCQVVVPG